MFTTENDLDILAERIALKLRAGDLMTLKQLQSYLGYSAPTIYKLIKENGLPVCYPTSHPRFLKVEVDNWLKEQI